MVGIVEFINARLDEEEAVASKAATQTSQSGNRGPGEWWVKDAEPGSRRSSSVGGCRVYTRGHEGSNLEWSLASVQHIADHDPARVLREVTAKRALITSTVKRIEQGWGYHDNEHMIAGDLAPLAAVYSDHPDYRTDW